ncbi:hypothetical protein PLICRDRAFT_92169 [Plicaturopsis crispa FD-325 SS-3]|nr:hypothetical protein PLICRDRAFT_92169 [Plicaturopsis crispa FD-325 SS-3]
MSSQEIEMDDLAVKTALADGAEKPTDDPEVDSPKDGVISLWAWTSTSLILLLASTLILFPRVLLFATAESERRTQLSSLERFLALHFGIFLIAIALTLLLNIPSPLPPVPARQIRAAPSHPLLGPLSGACVLSAFVSYNTTTVGSLSYLLFTGCAVIGVWGLWAIVFAGSSRTSRKTGADKRTSAFLFGNKSSASAQKKRWKKEQMGKAS